MDKHWRQRASCLGSATRYFDPWDVPESMFEPPSDVESICERCPVRVECLVDALKHNDHCVRGGTTKRQRDALKRPRWRSFCPVCRGDLMTSLNGQALQVCVACGLTWRTPSPR